MFDEDEVIAFSAATIMFLSSVLLLQHRRRRRYWVRPSLLARRRYSTTDLMKDLILDDEDALNLEYRSGAGFRNFFRVSSSTFEQILNMIAPRISRRDTHLRKAIAPHERLAVTLRFLATGDSYHSLQYTFKISKQLISQAVPEVCEAIIEELKDYIKMPQDEFAWREVAKTFDKWNFPNCVGAMDGKHVHVQAPIHMGTEYYNYKNFHSIVLFAVVDGDYNFVYASAGCQGRLSDGGVFNGEYFRKCLDDNTMHLPSPVNLPGRTTETPFVFVADDAFPLSTHIMKPFSGSYDKASKERIFNYRLSRARRLSENVFGIISFIFRVLRKPMLLEPKIATRVVLAIIYLHNFLRKSTSQKIYNPSGSFDQEYSDTGDVCDGVWRKDKSTVTGITPFQKVARRSKSDAGAIRNEFAEYFISKEGAVPFQWNK